MVERSSVAAFLLALELGKTEIPLSQRCDTRDAHDRPTDTSVNKDANQAHR